ncbi:MAG: hypothetical protein KTR31_02600 [Myxococcales bacterium]|nr:hypothetical protein [Myxococcales bacterium]
MLSLSLSLAANPAVACTCGPDAWFGPALPEDEAVDVPTNVRIVYPHGTMHHGVGYTLQTNEGASVVVDVLVGPEVTVLQPARPLEPDTIYVLSAKKGPYLHTWPPQTFTTGGGPDTSPPGLVPELTATSSYGEDCFGRQGWSAAIDGAFDSDEGPLLMEAEFTDQLGRISHRLSFDDRMGLTEVGCWPNFGFGGDHPLDVRVRAVDPAGNVGPWSQVVSVETPQSGEDDLEDTGSEATTAHGCATAPASGALGPMMLWLLWPRLRARLTRDNQRG